jgi:hypothetical protein
VSTTFEHEHSWPALLTEEESEEAAYGIEADFDNCVQDAALIAQRFIALLGSVAEGRCLGCRNVACRVVMLIEDLAVQDHIHAYHRRRDAS